MSNQKVYTGHDLMCTKSEKSVKESIKVLIELSIGPTRLCVVCSPNGPKYFRKWRNDPLKSAFSEITGRSPQAGSRQSSRVNIAE